MRKIRLITTLVCTFIVTSGLLFSAAFAGSDKDNANQSGQAAFKGNCVACHGSDGAGTPLGKSIQAADLRSPEVQKKSDSELAQTISDGKGNMPSFKRILDPEQVKAVVAYVRELGKSKP
jgi:mono/diheme cytochrome c family protein